MTPLCRDCLALQPAGKRRFHTCGSPRLPNHSARDHLAITHVDCDALYATIE